jgi:protoporphyrinogen oxidase
MIAAQPPVIVIGAGLAGLTAAVWLKRHGIPVRVLEAGETIAGLCQSEKDPEGFTYDCGAHFITNRLAAAVGISTNCRPMPRYGEAVWLRQMTYSYPFGLLRTPRFVGSALLSKAANFFSGRPESVAEHYERAYGAALASQVASPITEAWSGAPATELAAAVGDKFKTSLPWMIALRGAAWATKRTVGIGYSSTVTESPSAWHVYPNGGISAICEKLAAEVRDDIVTKSRVEAIEVEDNRVVAVKVNGSEMSARAAISTAPVHILAKLIHGSDELKYLADFKYRSMVFVNLKMEGTSGLPEVLTWTPEKDFPFFRLSDIGLGLPWLVPEGKAQVTCDIGCQVGDDVWTSSDDSLTERCKQGLEKIVPGISGRIFGSRVVRVPFAYPVYHLSYEKQRQKFERGTGIEGLVSVGRNGEFAHILMEDVYWRTRWKLAQLFSAEDAEETAAC